jgi:hypothetical protein
MLQELLESHVMDPKNAYKCYDLAKEYDRLEQGAMGVSLYLKAADLSNDKALQYKAMIGLTLIYYRQGRRDFTVEGGLLDAVALCPERPEAHYHLCAYYEHKAMWKHCLSHANTALAFSTQYNPLHISGLTHDAVYELGYKGEDWLYYFRALSTWYITGQQVGKHLFFDLKYKFRLDDELKAKVNNMVEHIWYPDTIPYSRSDMDRYKFAFTGIASVKENNSKHFQDMFVLSCFDGKPNGSYLEIGSGDPIIHNNTALLESKFGWKGISIDNNAALCYKFKENRSNTVICADATEINYQDLFDKHCMDHVIDYLQIDCDEASTSILNTIPFNTTKFGVITFEHDCYRLGTENREEVRRYLGGHGYVLVVPNVAFSEQCAYEDWYVHPDVIDADIILGLKGKKDINFIWDYMMEPLV